MELVPPTRKERHLLDEQAFAPGVGPLPRDWGTYRLLDEVGAGGMGVVYRAIDPYLRRLVAIKLTKADVFSDLPLIERRLRREAMVIARLNHPNIVSVYSAGELEGRLYIVMEYVNGIALDALIGKEGCLETFVALQTIEQLLMALRHIHEYGIVHRDIKPSNVLLCQSGRVKVVDFGIAKILADTTLALDGCVVGTPRYMAPEQRAGDKVDERADLFATGLMLYHMIIGNLPTPHPADSEDWLSAFESAEQAPPTVYSIMKRALRIAPAERYASAEAMLRDVRLALEASPAARESRNVIVPARVKQFNPEWQFVLWPGTQPIPADRELRITPTPELALQPTGGLACALLDHGLAVFSYTAGAVERLLLPHVPKLDDMLAATIVQRLLHGEPLPAGLRPFAEYAALLREGFIPHSNQPLENTLDAMFAGIRRAHGSDLGNGHTARQFLADWFRMERKIMGAAETGRTPYDTNLFEKHWEFPRARAFLARDAELFAADLAAGEQWTFRFPSDLESRPRRPALLLRCPTCVLFKQRSRTRPAEAGGPWHLLVVLLANGQWVISTDPVCQVSLRSLARRLQHAAEKASPVEAAIHPWYGGDRHQETLIATDPDYAALDEREIISHVRGWGDAE